MRHLILVRHSTSQPTSDLPNSEWQLTEEGRQRVTNLAETLKLYNIETIVTSTQAKAVKTGELLADILGVEVEDNIAEFDENDRTDFPFFDSIDEFRAEMKRFFETPSEIVVGTESAFDARGRFAGGIYELLDETPNGTVAVVTHGTVMSLFLGRVLAQPAHDIWLSIQELGMPCYAVLSTPDLSVLKVSGV